MSVFDFFNANRDKTFRPRKRFIPGSTRYDLMKYAQSSLHSGVDFRVAVRLPPNENPNDWIAVHVVDFFNRINLLYGTISEHCTQLTCPKMTGGSRYEYLWQDGEQYKKPTRLAAPVYIGLLMDWVEDKINNQQCFPVDPVIPFPKDFHSLCSKILTRLFRVFVHVYIHHFDRLLMLGGEAHVNTCLKHFYYFVTEYDLVAAKELEPLKNLIRRLTSSQAGSSTSAKSAA